ncbi:MAG: O-methyltransferase [Ekhidna sp.]
MISLLLFRAKHFLSHLLTAKGAHSLHSPFVFKLYNEAVKKAPKRSIKEIELLRRQLKKDSREIDVVDFKEEKSKRKTLSSVAKTSLSQPKFSSFLNLLVSYLDAHSALESGTSLGINTLYLSRSASCKKVITIEGSPIIHDVAKKLFIDQKDDKIELILGSIYDEFVPALIKHQPDVIFLDADHRSSAIEFYLENIITHHPTVKCIIIHDIYWSEDMLSKWNEIKDDNRFPLTIDVFQAGLIFPNQEMPKQHFKLKF